MNWIASVFVLCSVCRLRQAYEFHLVTEERNWTEAQKYCVKNHINLATVRDSVDMETLENIVQQTQNVWIGLHSGWQWSLRNSSFYKKGQDQFSHWEQGHPDNRNPDGMDQNCTRIGSEGTWFDDVCNETHPFICYDGRNNTFILVTEGNTWDSAQSYCRETHTDLASVRNKSENELLKDMKGITEQGAWIGLHRVPWRWSDRSNSTFTDWANDQPNNHNGRQDCVVAFWHDAERGGTWADRRCKHKHSFACYDDKLKLVDQNLTWTDALAYCRHRHRDLVSVHSEDVQQLVAQVAGRASSPYVWLGLRFSCTLGDWFWVRGGRACSSHWATSSGPRAGECGSAGALDAHGDLQWVSIPQTEQYNFICTDSEDY